MFLEQIGAIVGVSKVVIILGLIIDSGVVSSTVPRGGWEGWWYTGSGVGTGTLGLFIIDSGYIIPVRSNVPRGGGSVSLFIINSGVHYTSREHCPFLKERRENAA